MTSFIGAPILLIFLFWGQAPFALLILAISLICLFEVATILKESIGRIDATLAFVFGALYPIAALRFGEKGLLSLFALNLASALLLVLFFKRESLKRAAFTLIAPAYISFLFSHLILLRYIDRKMVLAVLFATWAFDTFAFLVGSKFGRIKVSPKISPNKTLEGTVAGFLAALIVLFVIRFENMAVLSRGLLGASIAAAAQVGDLIESKFKRLVKVKDSGSILPGHGGFLDRFDSLILAAPIAYYLFIYFGWAGR